MVSQEVEVEMSAKAPEGLENLLPRWHGQRTVLGHTGLYVRWFGFLHNMTAGFL